LNQPPKNMSLKNTSIKSSSNNVVGSIKRESIKKPGSIVIEQQNKQSSIKRESIKNEGNNVQVKSIYSSSSENQLNENDMNKLKPQMSIMDTSFNKSINIETEKPQSSIKTKSINLDNTNGDAVPLIDKQASFKTGSIKNDLVSTKKSFKQNDEIADTESGLQLDVKRNSLKSVNNSLKLTEDLSKPNVQDEVKGISINIKPQSIKDNQLGGEEKVNSLRVGDDNLIKNSIKTDGIPQEELSTPVLEQQEEQAKLNTSSVKSSVKLDIENLTKPGSLVVNDQDEDVNKNPVKKSIKKPQSLQKSSIMSQVEIEEDGNNDLNELEKDEQVKSIISPSNNGNLSIKSFAKDSMLVSPSIKSNNFGSIQSFQSSFKQNEFADLDHTGDGLGGGERLII